jgi:hypothetical protein
MEGAGPIDRAAHVDADAIEGDRSEPLRYAPAPFARSRDAVERPTAAARHRVAAIGVLAVLGGATVAVLFTSRPLADVEIAVATARPASYPPRQACGTQTVAGLWARRPLPRRRRRFYVLLRRPSSQTWTLGGDARADSTGAWAVDGMRVPEGADLAACAPFGRFQPRTLFPSESRRPRASTYARALVGGPMPIMCLNETRDPCHYPSVEPDLAAPSGRAAAFDEASVSPASIWGQLNSPSLHR